MNPLKRWRQKRLRRRGARQDEQDERFQRRQWFLLVGRRETYDPERLEIASLHRLYPPHEVFWADPFVWTQGQRRYIFFEERRYRLRRGRIQALELDADDRPAGGPFPVLEEPHHLSYPFLFEHDGSLYMMPEKSEQGRLDLYGCVRFPDRWELVRPLLDRIRVSDCTLFCHAGRWWLFCAVRRGRLRVNETLFAFHADDPLSPRWIAHPANPIVRDFACARPAGRIQCDSSGRLLRPGQDCLRRYGHGIRLNEILELSPSAYRERTIWHGTGPGVGGWRGMHHLDWRDGTLVMDAQRLIPGARPPLAGH